MVYKRSENEIKMISRSCQIVADTIDMLSEFVVPEQRILRAYLLCPLQSDNF